jgi:phospholipase C
LAARYECHDDWSTERHGGWYDLVITTLEDADFRVQAAGRIENGRDGISDPSLGRHG